MIEYFLGAATGLSGGLILWWTSQSEISEAWAAHDEERDRAQVMHRRAQKAEGRLQRIDHILAEGDEE